MKYKVKFSAEVEVEMEDGVDLDEYRLEAIAEEVLSDTMTDYLEKKEEPDFMGVIRTETELKVVGLGPACDEPEKERANEN